MSRLTGLMSKVANPVSRRLNRRNRHRLRRTARCLSIPPFGTGIIYAVSAQRARCHQEDKHGRHDSGESLTSRTPTVTSTSLKEYRQALIWVRRNAIREEVFEIPVKEANKGGLIFEWQGTRFLPASQLKADHYPAYRTATKTRLMS